jgi:hypothetical protein
MSVIDDFHKEETLKMSRLDRLVRNYPIVRNTSAISGPLPNNALNETTTIRPTIPGKIISIIILIFLSIIWIGLLSLILAYKFPLSIYLLGLLFISTLIFLVAKNSFFNKRYIYTISLNKEGIAFKQQKILWTDIDGTYIMNRQKGRFTNYFLVILKKEGAIQKLDLFKMGTYDKKLAGIIEYYKRKAHS